MFAFAVLACAPEPLPPGKVVDAGDVSVSAAAEAGDSGAVGLAETAPTACATPIYVAAAGNSTAAPVFADAHVQQWGAFPNPARVRLSFGDDPSTSMNVLWTTDHLTKATQLQLGSTLAYGYTLTGASFQMGLDTDDVRVHELRICGLQPGRTYHYRVGGEGHWSPDAMLTTAPTPGVATTFTFGVAGDSRGSPATWQQVAAAMHAQGVDFIVYNGDAVVNGGSMPEWKSWLDATVGVSEDTPMVNIMGNHEMHHQYWYGFVSQPGNEVWFSFDYANAHLDVLLDTVVTPDQWTTEAAWLVSDLAASTQPWKFSLEHKSAYASSKTSGADRSVYTYFVDPLENGGVSLSFAGHSHRYERSVALRDNVAVGAEDGVTYVVSGGAGAPLYTTSNDFWYTAVQASTYNYLIVSVDGSVMEYTAYDLAGNVLDAFTTTR